MQYDVVVVGGGVTGLAAAFELAARGVRFVLLEGSDRLGGLVCTEHAGGFTIEAGPDSMLAQKPAAIRLCEDLGLGPRLITTTPPRTAFVLKRGRLHALPSPSILGIPTTWRGLLGYDLLTPGERLRLGIERFRPSRRDPGADESVASFFRRRFGPASVGLIAEPLLAGIHAGDVEQLSVRSLFPRLVEAEARHRSVIRAFGRRKAPVARAGLFRSLAAGMGELVTAVERRLPPGAVELSAPVSALSRQGVAWNVTTPRGAFETRAVVLAVPARVASTLLAGIDSEAAALCGQVPYASSASVALAWPRAAVRHPLAGSGFVVARRYDSLRITACTWVSSKWAGRAPSGFVLLRAFIGGSHDPAVVGLPEADLVEIARADLEGVLGISGPPVLARVHKWPDAGAQHNVGQLVRQERIERRLESAKGLFLAGSGFRSVGIPDCVSDGRAAAVAAAQCAKMGG